jgi:hypothetical protein
MDDSPDDPARLGNRIRIPAVLVPAGQDPGPAVRGGFAQPIKLPVRIEWRHAEGQPDGMQRQGMAQDLPRQQSTMQRDGRNTAGASMPVDQAFDPNLPAGPFGQRASAPRGPAPGSAITLRPEARRFPESVTDAASEAKLPIQDENLGDKLEAPTAESLV